MTDLRLPESLSKLGELAWNFWWSWNQEAQSLFAELNSKVWDTTRNPVAVLKDTPSEILKTFSENSVYCAKVESVYKNFKNYMLDDRRWFSKTHSEHDNKVVAYFSAEYGIHESFPIYSGGLGVLSGDHVKTATDLGVPMVFVGLFYREGYFGQEINCEGEQVSVYNTLDPQRFPLVAVTNPDGSPLQISFSFPGRNVFARAWKAQVGRCPLYLLDSDVEQNSPEDRAITYRLYGGDRDTRISQEIILGIGGVKLLKQLNVCPHVWHMNEGHVGLLQLERIRNFVIENKLSAKEAMEAVSSNCVFTTHTPVSAGNEAFSLTMMDKYFKNYVKETGLGWDEFINLGLVREKSDQSYFCFTVLALKLSRFANGVSSLHGKVSRNMWRDLWPEVAAFENPITSITNGVHVQTWTAQGMKNLFSAHLGKDWENELSSLRYWKRSLDIPTTELLEVKKGLKRDLIDLIRDRLKDQKRRHGESEFSIQKVDGYLNENILTIGFARRFATYKRATLIFQDIGKLNEIVNHMDRPVQFVFAGKAHPADRPGQEFIKKIINYSNMPEFEGKIVFIENYDMNISRHMVSGVDVWLNNPRRPLEASGTSGQKVPLNAGINLSILDGWWSEGFSGENGWSIGKERDYGEIEVQDREDAFSIYRTIENQIAPLYYDDGANMGPSFHWLAKAKISLASNLPRFSSHRMVQDYVNQLYIPALIRGEDFVAADFKKVRDHARMIDYLARNWHYVTYTAHTLGTSVIEEADSEYNLDRNIHHIEHPHDVMLPGRIWEGTKFDASIDVYVGDIDPSLIACELVVTTKGANDIRHIPLVLNKTKYPGVYNFSGSGEFEGKRRARVRISPVLGSISSRFELGLVRWL